MLKFVILLITLGAWVYVDAAPALPCAKDQDCKNYFPGQQSLCVSNNCVCANGKSYDVNSCKAPNLSAGGRSALVPPLVGRNCNNDGDCNLSNGSCDTGPHQCKCNEGFIPAKNGTECAEALKGHDGDCQHNEQCSGILRDSQCTDGKCKCSDGSRPKDNACVKSISYGQTCDPDNDQCYQEGKDAQNALKCSSDKKCDCNDKYKLEDGKCVSSGASKMASGVAALMMVAAAAILA